METSTSTVNTRPENRRQRFASTTQIISFIVLVGIILVVIFHISSPDKLLLSGELNDELSRQYLQNLLRTNPNNHALSLQLAHSHYKLGELNSAENLLKQLLRQTPSAIRKDAEMLLFQVRESLLYREPVDSQTRKQIKPRVKQSLQVLLSYDLTQTELLRFAEKSTELGEPALTEKYYQKVQPLLNDLIQGQQIQLKILAAQEQQYYKLPMNDTQRQEIKNRLLASISAIASTTITSTELEKLATKTMALGEAALAIKYYERLASMEPDNMRWHLSAAQAALANRDYRSSATAYFAAMHSSKDPVKQRELFITGVKTLQSGNLFDEAITAIEREQKHIKLDQELLYELAQIARAANRLPLAEKYAKQLLRLP